MKLTNPRLASIRALAVAMCALALGACGGGAKTTENPITSGGSAPTYSGPAPATAGSSRPRRIGSAVSMPRPWRATMRFNSASASI